MGILGKIIGSAAAEPVKAIGGVLDELFTSKEEKLSHKEAMVRLEQRPHLAQIALNQTEAQHRSLFVAGWRPFIGWVCGTGLLWHFVLYDVLVFFAGRESVPELSGTDNLIAIVISLLGLGGYRTFEKTKGRAR